MISYTIDKKIVVVIVDGKSRVVPRGTRQAELLIEELGKKDIDKERVVQIADLGAAIETKRDTGFSIDGNGVVRRHGEAIDPVLADIVVENHREGVPFDHVLRFFDKLDANPSNAAKKQTASFLVHKGMPLTNDGGFLAYKGVRDDFWSIHGGDASKVLEGHTLTDGRIYNGVGKTIRVKRNYVEDNPDNACGPGLHAGSEKYALNWARNHNGRVVVVKVDPKDVVSVPKDSNCEKLRCCAYTVVAEYVGRLSDAAVADETRPVETAYRGDIAPEAVIDVEHTPRGVRVTLREMSR